MRTSTKTEKAKNSKNYLAYSALVLVLVLSVVWAVSLGSPAHSHFENSELVTVASPLFAIFLGFLVGTSIKGPVKALLNINRIWAWLFAFGFLWIHFAYKMEHGNSDGLRALDLVPRLFFITSFIWMAFHAGVAKKFYGWPWSKKPKNFHDWYVLLSWGVLVITIPVFSVPILGANQFLMALAWLVFAPHLLGNIYLLAKRTSLGIFNRGLGLWTLVVGYAVLEYLAAIRSFPGI